MITRLFSISWRCTHDDCITAARSFSFFTVLTYWGLTFYFLVSALHTGLYALRGRSLLERLPRSLQALHSLYYSSIVVYPFLVTIVYWAVLFPGYDEISGQYDLGFVAWEDVSQHAANSAFALFEIVLTRTEPMLWVHIVWLLVILAAYLGLAFVTLATQGYYVYGFLDYEEVGGRGIVAAYCVGIAVGTVVVFCVVWGVIWARRWVTETKLGMDGKFGKQPAWDGDAEVETARPKRQSQLGEPSANY